MMPVSLFRKLVKKGWPHVKVTVRTVSFSDLARAKKKCLTISGDREISEVIKINILAEAAGILPDGNIRGY